MIKTIARVLFLLVIASTMTLHLFPQSAPSSFLYQEESEEVKEAVEKSSRKEGRYPVDVAYNVQAALVSGTRNSVLIKWAVHPDFKDDLIIGRAPTIINTRERALSSTFIKVVNARDSNMYVDPDLPPGSYYYVVLAKERVSNRDAEIFPDMNQTSFPVVISGPEKKEFASVRRLTARKISADKVLLSWRGTGGAGVMYTIYRAPKAIANNDDLSGAIKVVSLTDAEQYIDDSIPVTGTYYYAVTTRQMDDQEQAVFIPGETYTQSGVFAYIRYSMVIQNISASGFNGDVNVRWEYAPSDVEYDVEGYGIYRAGMPISNYERLDFAKHVGTIDGKTTSFIDKKPGPGKHYYAVLVKFKNGAVDSRLYSGNNYTTEPVDFSVKENIAEPVDIAKPQEEKISAKEPGPPQVKAAMVDEVLSMTFFMGKYRLAIKELQDIAQNTDNKVEAAKARLFIGRSYIELDEFSMALNYLLLDDVRTIFPEESLFWREFAMIRVR